MLKQRFVNWLFRGVHLDEIRLGAHSVVISATGANMDGQKIENVGAPDSVDDVLRNALTENKIWVGNAANMPAEVDPPLGIMDFWSATQEEVQLTSTASDEGLPSVDVADLPTNATIVRAVAMFKFRMIENIHETEANNLVLDQYIQVKKTGQAFNNAIKMINLGFAIAAATREGGDVIIGNLDLAGENKVDANATYEFLWKTADAAQNNLQFNDVQVGLKIWYSV